MDKGHHRVCGTLLKQPKETNPPPAANCRGFCVSLKVIIAIATKELSRDTGIDLPPFIFVLRSNSLTLSFLN